MEALNLSKFPEFDAFLFVTFLNPFETVRNGPCQLTESCSHLESRGGRTNANTFKTGHTQADTSKTIKNKTNRFGETKYKILYL